MKSSVCTGYSRRGSASGGGAANRQKTKCFLLWPEDSHCLVWAHKVKSCCIIGTDSQFRQGTSIGQGTRLGL